ncbi:MAG: type II toxin-antitoxin system YafQ family toxin [Candidatus Pacebacteria bacterium]|nr:type II toxin-antitoxin system YafQ family toxin [Candidatus Paceibacterota bacterium]
MKYTVHKSSRFKKSLKRIKQHASFKADRLKLAITVLSEGKELPKEYHDHKLTGNLAGHRECHLAPDILLVYQIDDGFLLLTLVNIGNHSQLFN